MCLGCLCKPLHFAAICTLGSAGSVVWYCEWMWVHMSLKVEGCARCFAKCIVSFDATWQIWQYRFSFLHFFCNSFVLSWPGHATGRPASSEQHLPPASAHRPKPQMLWAATIRCALWTAVTGEPLPMELCHRVQSSSLTTLRNHYGQTEARLNQLPLAGRDLFWFGMWLMWLRQNVREKYLQAVWD